VFLDALGDTVCVVTFAGFHFVLDAKIDQNLFELFVGGDR